ncbi:MAG TPA: hypothetical protein VF146_06630 [Bryobacteraceae bacterium]
MARRPFSGMIGRQFANERRNTYQGKRQDNKTGYLQPQLVQHAGEVPNGCAHHTQYSSVRPAALHLVSGYSGRNA